MGNVWLKCGEDMNLTLKAGSAMNPGAAVPVEDEEDVEGTAAADGMKWM